MNSKPLHIELNEYKSIRYLNLFRLLVSFFFFSIIFEKIGIYVGITYKLDITKLLAIIYLSFSLLVWIVSYFYKDHSSKIGRLALVIDLPLLISLSLLFDGLEKGWAILPVITIGSYSILSRKIYAILIMPIAASLFLTILPTILGIDTSQIAPSSIILYSLTYFAIAFVGIRQSQTYSQSLLLTQLQKRRISSLSQINELIIEQMQSGVIAFNKECQIILINKKAREIIKASKNMLLPQNLINHVNVNEVNTTNSFNIHGQDLLIDIVLLEKHSNTKLLFIEQQSLVNEKSQQINLATLGQLSATIAHELRNPMAAIYSASELLQESEDINSEDKELTKIIAGQIRRSNKIIDDILLMSKPHIASQIKIDVAQKIKQFKKDFCMQNKINPENLSLTLPCEFLPVFFDTSHMNQLLWNLTENALKHGNDAKVDIVINNLNDSVLIDFRNNGEKLSPKTEESLFVPFFTTHTQGTGLGLYICKEMCKSNNSILEYLWLDSQHVFRIHIKKTPI